MVPYGIFFILLIFISYIRDIIRCIILKSIAIYLSIIIYGLLIFILSESILFITIFYSNFHFNSSSIYNYQDLNLIPDATELTYANTVVLSNAGITIGFHDYVIFKYSNYSCYFQGYMFLILQINEILSIILNICNINSNNIFINTIILHYIHLLILLFILII